MVIIPIGRSLIRRLRPPQEGGGGAEYFDSFEVYVYVITLKPCRFRKTKFLNVRKKERFSLLRQLISACILDLIVRAIASAVTSHTFVFIVHKKSNAGCNTNVITLSAVIVYWFSVCSSKIVYSVKNTLRLAIFRVSRFVSCGWTDCLSLKPLFSLDLIKFVLRHLFAYGVTYA